MVVVSSSDANLLVSLQVLKLVLLTLLLLIDHPRLVGQSVSHLRLLRPRLRLLEHLVEVRLLLPLPLVDRQVHRGLLPSRL